MKFLYIAPEHVSGTLSLFKREHERRGDTCRFITFWHSRWNFPDDICLNLAGMPDRAWVRGLRQLLAHDPHKVPSRIRDGKLPVWKPNWAVRALFSLRDEHNWRQVSKAISDFALFDFDILQLDGGSDFTRDARFARSFASRGKHVVSYFHGSDLRSRGYVPAVDEVTGLRLTPEWDLLDLDQRLNYLYLPFDSSIIPRKKLEIGKTIRIGHAARNPLKGTAAVESVVRDLGQTNPIELVLIKDVSYSESLRLKMTCDIFIDQLTNAGGWGYGMSGVEALAMRIPVITNVPPQMDKYLGEHPFVHADESTLRFVLQDLISDTTTWQGRADSGREWVLERHDIRKVADVLYGHYRQLGWLRT
ncbi:MAG: glycosyltransferase family 1 protein [bacterium]|nr:glycosyltransferase family 1 protein [bacterium]